MLSPGPCNIPADPRRRPARRHRLPQGAILRFQRLAPPPPQPRRRPPLRAQLIPQAGLRIHSRRGGAGPAAGGCGTDSDSGTRTYSDSGTAHWQAPSPSRSRSRCISAEAAAASRTVIDSDHGSDTTAGDAVTAVTAAAEGSNACPTRMTAAGPSSPRPCLTTEGLRVGGGHYSGGGGGGGGVMISG